MKKDHFPKLQVNARGSSTFAQVLLPLVWNSASLWDIVQQTFSNMQPEEVSLTNMS